MSKLDTISELDILRKDIQDYRKSFQKTMILCGGTGCRAARSHKPH